MLTRTEMISRLNERLRDFYYNNVLNYVEGQLRNNIKMVKLNTIPVTGAFGSPMRYVTLPSESSFFNLFTFNVIDVSWLYKEKSNYEGEIWITLEELCNTRNINIDVYTVDGLMIPKSTVWISIRNTASTYTGYIAVSANSVNNQRVMNEPMYLTIYMDTSIANDRRVYSYIPHKGHPSSKLQQIINVYKNNINKASIYINGYYYHRPDLQILNITYLLNKEVEVIVDENIDISFTIPSRNKYHSSTDNQYKDIIHIPKEFDEDMLRTINLAHIYVYNKSSKQGIKLPFTIDSSTYQLTYNDLGIPSDIVDNAQTFLQTEDIEIFVRFNDYQNVDNRIKFHNEWVPVLYSACNDDQLIEIFRGDVSELQGYVDGNTLEKSKFNDLMMGKYEISDDLQSLQILVEGLGYYNIPSIIGNTKAEINISTSAPLTMISVPKNVLIETGSNTFLGYVFVNGIKIPSYLCTYDATDISCNISISGNYHTVSGDKVDVKILVGDIASHTKITPTTSQYVFEITDKSIKEFDMFDVYQVVDTSSFNIVDHTNTHIDIGYTKLTDTQKNNTLSMTYNHTTNKATFTFSSNSYNKTYIIVPKYYNQYYSHQFSLIGNTYNPTESIIIYPTTNTANEEGTVPFLRVGDYEVFLNGRKLIEGLDYQLVKKEIQYSDTYLGSYITIQNKDYLKLNGANIVDIIIKGYHDVDSVNGFIVDKKFGGGDEINNLWFTDNTFMYIDGKFTRNNQVTYAYHDEFVVTGDIEVENVESFLIHTSIPRILDDLIGEYVPPTQHSMVTAILNYLLKIDPWTEPTEMEVVTKYRTVYSSLLNSVIYRILTDDNIGNSYSYTDAEINDLLSEFEYLKPFDVIFNDGFLEELPIRRKFYNLRPGYIEIDPSLITDLRGLPSTVNVTKIILIRAVIDHVLVQLNT